MKKEARAEIRERKESDGLSPDEHNEFLELLKEDSDVSEPSMHLHHLNSIGKDSRTTTISEGSGNSNDEPTEDVEAEFDLHKKYSGSKIHFPIFKIVVSLLVDSTKFEEGNKLLVGQSKDGKEVF